MTFQKFLEFWRRLNELTNQRMDVFHETCVEEYTTLVDGEVRSVGDWKVEREPPTHVIVLDGLVNHAIRAVVKKVSQHDEQVCKSMTLRWYEHMGHLILYASALSNI
jgi:hypothetical protein